MKLGPKEIKVVNEYFVRPVKNRLKEIFLKKGLPQLKTSDEIERPQRALDKEAIDAFMKRNPKLQGEFKKDPKLVKLFNEGKLYHYRTTIGAEGGPKDKKAYRGTKEELEKIMKQGKSTGKPVVLTAKMKSNIKEYEDRTGKKYEDLPGT